MKTPAWPEGDLPPGTRVGAYVIREAIGRGGAQAAYLAESDNGEKVVLKMSLLPMGRKGSSHRRMHDRFMRQTTHFRQLSGTVAIPRMFGDGMFPDASQSGYAYLVQEWVPGGLNIVEWGQEKPHELKTIVAGWILLAKACAKMTRRGICHRDLKPANILVRPDGIPKIVDFNSGRSVGAEPLTTGGPRHWPGTTLYYAPEVCRALLMDPAAVDRMSYVELATADLHALGVIFYQVLTGVYPFDKHASEPELFEQIACEVPDPPRILNPEVPAGLDNVTMKLLRKDPEKRYQFGDEVAAELWALMKTNEDWTRPFQTPAKEQRRAPSRSRTSRTTTGPSPSTPMATDGSAAFDMGPSAIVVARPRALVLLPRPEPEPRPSVLRRRFLAPAALIAALGASWLFVGQPGAGPLIEKGTTVVSKAKMVVVAATSAAFSACAGLTGKVRTGDLDWLAKCPQESRETARALGLSPDDGDVWLEAGPNVLIPEDGGVELRNGPVEATASIPAAPKGVGGRLYGEIQIGSDGASIHFTRFRLYTGSEARGGPPTGREMPVCAIAYEPYKGVPPGLTRVEHPNSSELHPGYVLFAIGRLFVSFAH